MTLQITKPEVEALIRERLQSGQFADAEEVILEALRTTRTERANREGQRREAVERLKTFGRRHGLSLDGLTIRELREKARP